MRTARLNRAERICLHGGLARKPEFAPHQLDRKPTSNVIESQKPKNFSYQKPGFRQLSSLVVVLAFQPIENCLG